LTGRHVLLAFLGFFAVVFVADGIMIYKAVSTFGGLETADAYRRGLAYNDRIAAAAEQTQRGWHDRLDYVVQSKRLRVTVTDGAGAAVSGLALTAQLQRPATDRFDQAVLLEPTGPGIYEGDASGLAAGWWTVDLRARQATSRGDDTHIYESRRRLWIKP
jgi:nitrogen fixation protein FixH